jgi:hypothetical protein
MRSTSPLGLQVELLRDGRPIDLGPAGGRDRLKDMKPVTLEYQGKQITATLDRGQTLSGKTPPQEAPPMWYVTIGGTALTKFPATPGDSEASVRRRVLAWLKAHPDMLDRDQIVLGGG